MTSEQAAFLLKEIYLPQIEMEHEKPRRVIGAIPAAQSAWKPDPKSMGALELAWHIADSECMFLNAVAAGKFDHDGTCPESVKTPADVLRWDEENFPKAVERLRQAQAADLVNDLSFFGMFTLPAVSYAHLAMNHSIHHRGQLSVYLRPMGSKVPGIYGPSADEPIQRPAGGQA
jgi:uncharacterized damage-inducible protein DinB